MRAAWDAVAPLYAGKKRVIYGRSLGTGLAAALSADVQSELTVLVSPYESMLALAPQAQLLRVAGAAHNDVHEFPSYLDGLRAALRR